MLYKWTYLQCVCVCVCVQRDEQAVDGGAGEEDFRQSRQTGAGVHRILHRCVTMLSIGSIPQLMGSRPECGFWWGSLPDFIHLDKSLIKFFRMWNVEFFFFVEVKLKKVWVLRCGSTTAVPQI